MSLLISSNLDLKTLPGLLAAKQKCFLVRRAGFPKIENHYCTRKKKGKKSRKKKGNFFFFFGFQMSHACRKLQMIKLITDNSALPSMRYMRLEKLSIWSGQCFKRIRQRAKEKASGQSSIRVSIGTPKKRMILHQH